MYITYIEVNEGRKSAIMNLIKLTFLRSYVLSLPETTHFALSRWSSYLARSARYQAY